MRKIKYLLIFILSILFLNSCLITPWFIGGLLEEYGGNFTPSTKVNDYEGILVMWNKNQKNKEKIKRYSESLKKRELTKIKLKSGSVVTVPKGFIIPKSYLLDNENSLGIEIGMEIKIVDTSKDENKYYEQMYKGNYEDYKVVEKKGNLYRVASKKHPDIVNLIKKISDDEYAVARILSKEGYEIIDEITTYLIEKL